MVKWCRLTESTNEPKEWGPLSMRIVWSIYKGSIFFIQFYSFWWLIRQGSEHSKPSTRDKKVPQNLQFVQFAKSTQYGFAISAKSAWPVKFWRKVLVWANIVEFWQNFTLFWAKLGSVLGKFCWFHSFGRNFAQFGKISLILWQKILPKSILRNQ